MESSFSSKKVIEKKLRAHLGEGKLAKKNYNEVQFERLLKH